MVGRSAKLLLSLSPSRLQGMSSETGGGLVLARCDALAPTRGHRPCQGSPVEGFAWLVPNAVVVVQPRHMLLFACKVAGKPLESQIRLMPLPTKRTLQARGYAPDGPAACWH